MSAAADVAVVPSVYEPFGLVALEAAALGTPLVVADTGGLAEIVEHGESGLVFPPLDAAALADAVSEVLRDEVLARRVVRTARAVVERDYAWPTIAAGTVTVYERAVREERALLAELAARPPGTTAVARGAARRATCCATRPDAAAHALDRARDAPAGPGERSGERRLEQRVDVLARGVDQRHRASGSPGSASIWSSVQASSATSAPRSAQARTTSSRSRRDPARTIPCVSSS